jgi:endonuclease/exonuclease/phosphatase family metal-dependent hydrolase
VAIVHVHAGRNNIAEVSLSLYLRLAFLTGVVRKGIPESMLQSPALRIGTFNARFLPHLLSNRRRARLLAERIAEYDYDIMVLSEVFSERARRALLGKLSSRYRYIVQYIGSRRRLRDDSGLVLLSKYPFQTLPGSTAYGRGRLQISGCQGSDDGPAVWFVEYADCCCSDCLAGKGAAYVRLGVNDRRLHVFFTHMQARYDFHGPKKQQLTREIRAAQLHQLSTLVREALSREPSVTDDVLLLGDFNVDGVRTGEVHTAAEDAGYRDGEEWFAMLDTLSEHLPNGLVDAWHEHVPLADPGFTYPATQPAARRDYILLSAADRERTLCVQHVAIAHNLTAAADDGVLRTERGTSHLSDHLGINADLNWSSAGCHPRDAHQVSLTSGRATVTGRIEYAGALQWYRLHGNGGFMIGLEGSDCGIGGTVQIYAASDISRPLLPLGSTASSLVRSDPGCYILNGDCLVRVGEPQSLDVGEYVLTVRAAGR